MKKLILLSILWTPLFAQTPQLSTADKIALQAQEKSKSEAQVAFATAQQTEATILGEWTKAHPGYHVDPQTFVVSTDKPTPSPAKPGTEHTPPPGQAK